MTSREPRKITGKLLPEEDIESPFGFLCSILIKVREESFVEVSSGNVAVTISVVFPMSSEGPFWSASEEELSLGPLQ